MLRAISPEAKTLKRLYFVFLRILPSRLAEPQGLKMLSG